MKKIEICGLCKKQINTKTDDFCHLIDYKKGKFLMEGFYHKICWVESLRQNRAMKHYAMNTLRRANVMLNQFGGGKTEYEVQ